MKEFLSNTLATYATLLKSYSIIDIWGSYMLFSYQISTRNAIVVYFSVCLLVLFSTRDLAYPSVTPVPISESAAESDYLSSVVSKANDIRQINPLKNKNTTRKITDKYRDKSSIHLKYSNLHTVNFKNELYSLSIKCLYSSENSYYLVINKLLQYVIIHTKKNGIAFYFLNILLFQKNTEEHQDVATYSLHTYTFYFVIFLTFSFFLSTFILLYKLKAKDKQQNRRSQEKQTDNNDITLNVNETDDKYQMFFKTIIDPVLIADQNSGIIVECNRKAEILFGKTRNELIGIHQSQLDRSCKHKNNGFKLSHNFQYLCNNPNTTIEITLQCAFCRTKTLSAQAVHFEHNKQLLIMVIFHDTTQQKQLFNSLEKRERLLRKAQSIVKLGHWELDTINNKLFWSEEVYHIFGIDPREQEMSYETFMDCVHPEDREAVNHAYSQSIREKQDGYEISHRIIRKNDSQLCYVQEKCEHIKNQEGEITLSIGTVQDTTEQSTTEIRLREALFNAELANKSKSIFLANMSHEIRTPLNGILGMLQLLRFENQTSSQLEYITHAMNSGERLTKLLSDILDLTKVDAGVLTLRTEPFDLNELIQSITQLFTPAIKQKGLDFQTFIDFRVQTKVIGDALRLQQVLTNILGNAVKFTGSGSVELEIFPLPSSEEKQCNLLFSISDEGIGIPEDKLAILFDPFSQVENSYTRRYQGAGLGLSIAKNLISLMGGDISVASSPGVGTCFQFCIPLKVDTAQLFRTEQQKNTYALSECNILLAEDDAVSQRAISGLLRRMGQKVRIVENGRQALTALQNEHFDIVLMDIQMPVMEGVAATKAIRAGQAGNDKKNIPIVAITAYAMVGDREFFLDAGMNAYIPKPIHYDHLQNVLTNFIESPSESPVAEPHPH